MSCSPARLAANRLNALKSTGPRTTDGKAASRRNACRHGLAGAGDIAAPGEDLTLVAERAATFVRELGATGALGELLAHRVALLSVRMERAAVRDFAAIAANVAAAHEAFDTDRRAALDEAVAALAAPGDPRPALAKLERTPEGLAHLATAWVALADGVEAADPTAAARARRWLDLTDDAPVGTLHARLAAELDRLHGVVDLMRETAAAVAAARERAGVIASFDPSPEANLARRYEAAAERGMYRALRAIADLRRTATADLPPLEASPARPPACRSPAPPAPPALVAPAAPVAPTLGSFRAGVSTASTWLAPPLLSAIDPPLVPTESRKKRPDLRKLAHSRR